MSAAFMELIMPKADVQACGCWLWTGSKMGKGYGKLYYQGKERGAHRVSLLLSKGGDLDGPLLAMHSCDTPLCVNPSHLSWGTQTDNMRDASRRGRCVRVQDWRGAKNPKSKLKPGQDREIEAMDSSGRTRHEIAGMYGVTTARVGQICREIRRQAEA